jgi:hypothetical protein
MILVADPSFALAWVCCLVQWHVWDVHEVRMYRLHKHGSALTM